MLPKSLSVLVLHTVEVQLTPATSFTLTSVVYINVSLFIYTLPFLVSFPPSLTRSIKHSVICQTAGRAFS